MFPFRSNTKEGHRFYPIEADTKEVSIDSNIYYIINVIMWRLVQYRIYYNATQLQVIVKVSSIKIL